MNAIKEYWNNVGESDSVNYEISHIADEDAFYASGEKEGKRIFKNDLSLLPAKGNVLELGCGRGRIIRYLASQRPEQQFYGVDVSEKMIERAYPGDNVKYSVNDGIDLFNFNDCFFTAVYCFLVFQHLPRAIVRSYIREIIRVLEPGGTFIFQVQSGTQKDEPIETDYRKIRYYSVEAVRELIVEPLRIDKMIIKAQASNCLIYTTKRKEIL